MNDPKLDGEPETRPATMHTMTRDGTGLPMERTGTVEWHEAAAQSIGKTRGARSE